MNLLDSYCMSNKVNKNKKIKNDQGEFQWESLILSTWIKKKKKRKKQHQEVLRKLKRIIVKMVAISAPKKRKKIHSQL